MKKDFFTPAEYLKNFNWFSFWVKRNFIEILEHFLQSFYQVYYFCFF